MGEEKINPVNNTKVVNLAAIIRQIRKNWWMLLLNCSIIGAISALLIVEEPRTYTSEVQIAPEAENQGGGALSSIASSFGLDLGNMATTDAIRPELYPDLVNSTDFILEVFKIPVKTMDGNVYTDYSTYLRKYQKSSWWRRSLKEFTNKFKESKPKKNIKQTNNPDNDKGILQQRILSEEDEAMVKGAQGSIICNVDKKTFTISIVVTDQDPLVAATVADSVCSMIQNFVTEYRTQKAIKDYNYYFNLLKQAKEDYEVSCANYAQYVDTHRDVILQSYISERDQLENDMQVKLNTYNAVLNQANTAKAKVQESTPVFTILQNAYVPFKPTGPKRMLFVIGMVFLTFTITTFTFMWKMFASNLK